jgi:hypothetical protein
MVKPLRSPLRWVAAVLMLATAAVHLPLVPEHLEEAPYVGVLFVALAVVGFALAVLLVTWDSPVVWVATGLVTLLAVVAFLASRTVGLPGIGDDIGNWTDPLGFPALASEALATVVAAAVLRRRPLR